VWIGSSCAGPGQRQRTQWLVGVPASNFQIVSGAKLLPGLWTGACEFRTEN